jgi:hypothetical protein
LFSSTDMNFDGTHDVDAILADLGSAHFATALCASVNTAAISAFLSGMVVITIPSVFTAGGAGIDYALNTTAITSAGASLWGGDGAGGERTTGGAATQINPATSDLQTALNLLVDAIKTSMSSVDGKLFSDALGGKETLRIAVYDGAGNQITTFGAAWNNANQIGNTAFQAVTVKPDGTNVMPSMDVATRRGYQQITDGTNYQPTMDTLARAGHSMDSDEPLAHATDWVSTTVCYVGYALPGILAAGTTWSISRITLTGDNSVTEWADGTGAFTKTWTARAGYAYS